MNTETVLIDSKSIPVENLIEFSVMGLNGDTKVYWNKANPAEVDAAREHFKSLRAKGYLAYKLNPKDDSKGEQVTEFNPEDNAVIFSPALRGG